MTYGKFSKTDPDQRLGLLEDRVTRLTADLDKAIGELQKQLDAFAYRLAEQDRKVAAINEAQMRTDNELGRIEDALGYDEDDETFDHLDALNQRLAVVEGNKKRIVGSEERIRVGSAYDELSARIGALNISLQRQMQENEARAGRWDAENDDLRRSLTTTNELLFNLQYRLNVIEANNAPSVTDFNDRVVALRSMSAVLERKLLRNEERQATFERTVREEIVALRAAMERADRDTEAQDTFWERQAATINQRFAAFDADIASMSASLQRCISDIQRLRRIEEALGFDGIIDSPVPARITVTTITPTTEDAVPTPSRHVPIERSGTRASVKTNKGTYEAEYFEYNGRHMVEMSNEPFARRFESREAADEFMQAWLTAHYIESNMVDGCDDDGEALAAALLAMRSEDFGDKARAEALLSAALIRWRKGSEVLP
jgi:hypothetical protein